MTGLTVLRMRQLTKTDPILGRVLVWVQEGWPNHVAELEMKPYFTRKDELSSQHGCLLWGSHQIVPLTAREEVLNMLT